MKLRLLSTLPGRGGCAALGACRNQPSREGRARHLLDEEDFFEAVYLGEAAGRKANRGLPERVVYRT
jgi:hypothetical protein